jgi:hypothetical protein
MFRYTKNTITHEAAAYHDGDDLGAVFEIANAVADSGGEAILESVTIVDAAKQSSALALLLFDSSPTVSSAENAALDIADAIIAANCLAVISIPAASYFALNASSVVHVDVSTVVKAAAGSTSLYGQLLCKGAPTYVSTTDLTVKLGFNQGE